MTSRFQILGSSSEGNCAYLEANGLRILVDAGFSGKKTLEMLEKIGVSIEQIDAVFLTHDHCDHAQGVRGLAQFSHLKFFANRDTVRAVEKTIQRSVNWQVFESGKNFQFDGITVETLKLPHDAYDPVGYIFRWGKEDLFSSEGSVAWMQDLGYVTNELKRKISDIRIIAIESNHDLEMLDADKKRPWRTKERIRGRMGHLNNGDIVNLFSETDTSRISHVLLTHLSRDCNCPQLLSRQLQNIKQDKALPKFHIIDPGARIVPPLFF